MNQKNFRAEARQIQRLFARGIAAADHDERLVAEHWQRAIARGAISHALGFQQILAGHTEMPVACSGGDDNRLDPDLFAVHGERERTFGKIHLLNRAKADARAETLGLFLHSRHQFIAVHAFGEAGIIFHDAGGGEQTARLNAGQHARLEIGARGVKRRRPSRAARTDDNNFFHKRMKHDVFSPKFQASSPS